MQTITIAVFALSCATALTLDAGDASAATRREEPQFRFVYHAQEVEAGAMTPALRERLSREARRFCRTEPSMTAQFGCRAQMVALVRHAIAERQR